MKNENNTYEYTYSAPTENERREIDSIRKSYLPKENVKNKLELLRSLDRRVKRPAQIGAILLGIVGLLIFGLGMSMSLSWNEMLWGCVVGFLGCIFLGMAYPFYQFIFKIQKKKYSNEILRLSEELLKEEKN